MSAEIVVERLRRFLLILAGLICAATVVELWLIKHTKDPIQLLPFILCGLGLAAVVVVLLRPQRRTLRALQGIMGLLILGSLIGVYEHIASNLEFALEIQPNAATNTLIFKALGGANPLLAPGMLAFAALLAIAATYYHPTLATSKPAKR
jgi:hypothetical protein